MLPIIELKTLILLFYVCKELSANENEMKNDSTFGILFLLDRIHYKVGLILGILKTLGPNTRKMTSR